MSWQCPYCQLFATLRDADQGQASNEIHIGSKAEAGYFLITKSIQCPNPKCRKLTISADLFSTSYNSSGPNKLVGIVESWRLAPRSSERPQPDYIPAPLREDYSEACQIRDLSPKASATLARRCLQGMIRDFCGIKRNRLVDEINDLRKAVSSGAAPRGVEADTLDAIDHVRKIGNIGAHMEADINVIVDVDPHEAQKLIELLELLFEEWYVAREKRAEKLKALGVMAAAKSAAKALPAPAPSQKP